MPGPQTFDDTASVNGKVSGGGGSYSVSGANSSGDNSPAQKNAGTENLRAATVTKRAENPSAKNSSGDKSPAQKFGDGTSV